MHGSQFVGWTKDGGHLATRQIGIDMGHRVTNHGSKCRNIHGHRYTIEATIGGELVPDGASEGMLLDFGFLKEEMMNEIDEPCDHGLCLWVKDPLVAFMFQHVDNKQWVPDLVERATTEGQAATFWEGGKLYLIDKVPTAENLAEHWFRRLEPRVSEQTDGRARLVGIRVWETPNCFADFVGPVSK